MDCKDHDEQARSPDVLVRCSQDVDLLIRLSNRQFIDSDETVFSIEAMADGLRVAIPDVTVAIWDGAGDLAAFLQQLADDFRGWPGKRVWHTNQLTLEAGFHSGGHVELTWKLRPWSSQQAAWETSITTWIEGGQQLTALASDVQTFLARS
ncbi:DUF6228 family protein [Microbispora bryophytorum]|uniref:DUF6228 family protein n=1 Tax=Microbispora bryophytorum TaxID=1460882 RepID=UPI00295EA0C5|nr:DUF6228 family protein [Microbispora camponoti]